MTYHPRPLQKRKCAHCQRTFNAAHKSRIYCSSSCNTLAWRARNAATAADAGPHAAQPAGSDLPFSAQTVGVVAAGTLAANAGTYLAQQLWQGGTDTELLRAEVRAAFADLRADLGLPAVAASASFVPAAVRTATGPVVHIGPKGGPRAPFVQVPFQDRLLYYCAAQDVLLCATAPNTYQRVSSAAELATLVATPAKGPKGREAPARLPLGVARPPAAFPDLDLTHDGPAQRVDDVAAQARQAAEMADFERILLAGLGLESKA